MKLKKLKLLLTTVLIGSFVLSGCGSLGKKSSEKDSDRTLRILTGVVGGKDAKGHELFVKELEKHLGCKVEMVKPSADYDKKMFTALSSGENYDLVYSTAPNMNILIDKGAIKDLSEDIKNSKILSDTNKIPESEWDLIKTKDGKLYGVPNKFEGGTMPIVRKDWLKELGMKTPVTLDDWHEYFKAAKKKYGAYGISTSGLYDIQGFMSAAGVKAGYVEKDGKKTIPYATKEAAPIYDWFAKLNKEGLLDPNFASNGSDDFRKLFLSDKAASVTYWDMWVGLFNNMKKSEDPNTKFEAEGVPAVPDKDGKITMRRGDSSVWLMPVNAKNQDLAMKFLEFWHSDPGYIMGTLGVKDYDYKVNNGKYTLTEIGEKAGMDHGAPRVSNPNWKNPIGELPGVKKAQEIAVKYGTIENLPAKWDDAKPIVEKWAFKAMKGEVKGEEAVNNMQKELKSKNLID
ncbi:ABC transporter substrate-binding protein [Clostridium oceanicum]|uniref:Lipoprotein LipO n=1 Tax=Clostridium oceanicum TaxID=1543 RepID=A0ABN1J935_9CLOT